MEETNYTALIHAAKKVECESYTPITNRAGDAALLAKGGSIFTGCSLEVSNYASSICPGKAALAKAISDGAREFVAVAITGKHADLDYLCGDCRQAYAEFGGELIVIFEMAPEDHKILSDLLPG